MRILTYFIGVVFLLFALVQFNDPDPVLWIAIYLIPAVISLTFTHRKWSRTVLAVLAILYIAGAIFLFPTSLGAWISAEEKSKSLNMTLPGIEEARESMGLLICFLTVFFFWIKSKSRS